MPRRLTLAPHRQHLIDVQDSVLSVAQARECGHTRSSIHHAVKVGRWQRLLPGVLLMHDQVPTRRQLLNAATIWAGAGAAIDAESACVWHGIPVPRVDEDRVHVVVPYESGARSRDFVVVRRSDVIVEGGHGAVTRYVDAATAAVVAARRQSSDRAAVALLSRPLQTGLVTLDDLVAAHMHAPPRGARLVARAIEQLAVGVRSGGESVAQRLLARSEVLPQVLWNRWLRLPGGGALVCVDGLIVEAGMVLEINSRRYHAWALTFEDTEARQLRLVAADLVVAPVTPRRAIVEGPAVLREVEQTYLLNAGRGLPRGVELVDDPIRRVAA
jgi:hypothetical protein